MRTLSFLFVLLMICSCKHVNDSILSKDVIIGENSQGYTIIKPDPAILISESHPDSLDLNSDGVFEIKFMISPIQTSTVPGSRTDIITKNNLQILLSRLYYEDPDTLSAKSLLNNDSYWSDSNSSGTFTLLNYACYTYSHCLGSGNFKNVDGKYIGFKLENKFGWIKVDSYTAVLTIKEYTVLD